MKKLSLQDKYKDFTPKSSVDIIENRINGSYGKQVKNIGMTDKQFQGFVRLTLTQIDRALEETPDNKELQKLKDIFQNMLEDGN